MRFADVFPRLESFGLGLILIAILQILTGCGEDGVTAPMGDPDAQLVLLEPKGGETFHTGDSLWVRWKAQGKGLEEINSVAIWLSPDSGQSWITIKNGSIAPADREWGRYGWKVPANILINGGPMALGGDRILIRVQDYQNVSDPNKTAVVPKPITVQP